jgi:hypothetical protein
MKERLSTFGWTSISESSLSSRASWDGQPRGSAWRFGRNEVILGREVLVMTYPFTVVNRHLVMPELNTGKKFWCLFGRVVLC